MRENDTKLKSRKVLIFFILAIGNWVQNYIFIFNFFSSSLLCWFVAIGHHIECTPTCAGLQKIPEHLMKYNRHGTNLVSSAAKFAVVVAATAAAV